MAEPLDPLRLPLRGSRLIEASAGTGKTWTIAALYLRLVLGHGRPHALLPGQILVMTFTRAATRELSDRIRTRLVEAAACFRGERPPPAHDALLPALLADFPAGEARSAAAWRLAMAAEAMDDAAIHTIDAWCQRMLREHAFDSGCLFDEELAADESALLREAVHDYWRQQVYPLDGAALAAVTGVFPGVAALQAAAKDLLGKPLPADAGRGELLELVPRLAGERARQLAALKPGWIERVQAMRDWLVPRWDTKQLDGNKLRRAAALGWLDTLAAWAADPQADTPELNKGRERLTPAQLRLALKDRRLEPPPVFADFEALMAALDALPAPGPALRAHAAARIGERLRALKAQAGRFGFADLLERLDAALDAAAQGERAQRLRERIVTQYPVAMIDEFQDTSPIQLRIFDRLYRIAADDPATTLLLIGDPKQAIYGFRGADIHSYLLARRETAGRHHVLTTNFRSTAPLVDAVNRVFSIAEAREGEGAFGFRRPGEAPGQGGLPFVDVEARGRAERLRGAGGVPLPPLTLLLDPVLRGAPEGRERLAALCAERIVALLADPAAGFDDADAGFRRLRPAHLAILVRTGTEAAAVRRALRRRGVASVYLSDKDSVYASDEARDLLRLLQAAAAPRDVRRVRSALATAMLGLELPALLRLAGDDEAFDAQAERFALLQRVWQQQGVLAMIRRALQLFELPARWLAGDGERRLTNLLHLAELLQADSAQLDGEQALIRIFAQQLDEAAARAGAGEEQVLRLESDADLVQVVTVHKSKGLEYPLVFLPFAAHVRGGTRRPGHVHAADDEGVRRLVLAPREEDHDRAERERLREDLRLLYVALTRARHALWVGAAALKIHPARTCGWHRSALGRLVSGAAELEADGMADAVRRWAAQIPGLRLEEAADHAVPATRWTADAALPPLLPAAAYDARFDRSWAIGSYSSLVKDLRADEAASGDGPVEAAGRTLRDDEPAEAAPAPPAALATAPWHRFPRGAFAGDFLHQQLEWLAGEGFALDTSATLQQALRRRCERQGWGHRADDVLDWLRQVCRTPLPALGGVPAVPLAGLERVLPEMEFWFPAERLPAREVDMLCRLHVLPGRPRPALPERTLHGMLMGFADLVYEHHGRYGVLDHKSNALGPRDADYGSAAMEAAMLEHRYDVQAALYLLALHRLLRARLGLAYRPAEQLHGAVYLFLRGIAAEGGGAWRLAPPWALLDALDALLGMPATADEEGGT